MYQSNQKPRAKLLVLPNCQTFRFCVSSSSAALQAPALCVPHHRASCLYRFHGQLPAGLVKGCSRHLSEFMWGYVPSHICQNKCHTIWQSCCQSFCPKICQKSKYMSDYGQARCEGILCQGQIVSMCLNICLHGYIGIRPYCRGSHKVEYFVSCVAWKSWKICANFKLRGYRFC